MAKKKAKPKPKEEFPWITPDLRPLARPIDSVKPDSRNAREHDEANINALVASLQEFGQVKPIVVNKNTREIEAGNATYLAAQHLRWTHIAIVEVVHDDGQKTGYAIADNYTAELAHWNDQILQELLLEYREESVEAFHSLGFTELLVDEAANAAAVVKLDVKAPPPMTWVLIGIPTVRFGEIAETVADIAGLYETVVEMTSNDDEPADKD